MVKDSNDERIFPPHEQAMKAALVWYERQCSILHNKMMAGQMQAIRDLQADGGSRANKAILQALRAEDEPDAD